KVEKQKQSYKPFFYNIMSAIKLGIKEIAIVRAPSKSLAKRCAIDIKKRATKVHSFANNTHCKVSFTKSSYKAKALITAVATSKKVKIVKANGTTFFKGL